MNIQTCSRGEAVGFKHDKSWAVISIRNPDMTPVDFECPNLAKVLYLEFDDINKITRGMVAFSIEMAEQVWDFVDAVGDVDLLLIHCNLGSSRSPGVAAAIAKVKTGDDMDWFKRKTPNSRVYAAMLAVANQRGLIDADSFGIDRRV